jgi:tripartite-type tricarboxylate transporter receptor subunit TctC
MTHPSSTRRSVLALTGSLLLGGGALAQSGAFPNKPIRFIIPTAPGGNLDALARIVADKLTQAWGQQVVVDPRPGANTLLATMAVARAPADGYTVLFTISGFVQNLVLQPNPTYTLEDFVPVSEVASFPIALAATSNLPANDLAGIVKLAKEAPDKMSFASYGTGSGAHLIGEGLNKAAGVRIKHVAYKGEAPAFNDLVAGRVELAYGSVGFYGRQLSGGRVKLIAVASPQLPHPANLRRSRLPRHQPGRLGRYVPAGRHAGGDYGQICAGDPADRGHARRAGQDSGHGLRADRQRQRRVRQDPGRRRAEMGPDRAREQHPAGVTAGRAVASGRRALSSSHATHSALPWLSTSASRAGTRARNATSPGPLRQTSNRSVSPG